MNNFSIRLKELMKDNELEVKDIAIVLNLDYQSIIYDWLNGEVTPRLNTLVSLADHFEISIEYLLGRTENNEKIKSKKLPEFSSNFKKVLKDKKVTQYRLLKDSIVSRGHLNSWLKNKNIPSTENLIKIADYLDVSVDYLIGRI